MNYPIGEIAKLFDITTFSIRFYEKKGLLKPVIDPKTLYRYYNFNHIIKIKAIVYLKTAGFSIDEIKEIMEAQDCKINDKKLSLKEKELDQKIEELQKWKSVLKIMKNHIDYIAQMTEPFEIRYNEEAIVLAVFENIGFVEQGREICPDFSQHYLCIEKEAFLEGKIVKKASFGFTLTQTNLFYLEKHNIPYQKIVFDNDKKQKYLYTLLEFDYENEPDESMAKILNYLHVNGYEVLSNVIFKYIAATRQSTCDLYELWIPVKSSNLSK